MYYVRIYHPTRQYRMCHFREKSNNSVRALKDNDQSTQIVAIFKKSIGDDTKATARQSPNGIKRQEIKLAKNDFQYGA